MSEDVKVLPLRITFPHVLTEGETFAYKLPSAYPEPKSSWSVSTGTGSPQYYQFDSTALLKKKGAGYVKIFFKKSAIDSNFVNPSNIVVGYYNGKKWRNAFLSTNVVVKSGKQFYRVKVPKRKYLNCLIAFFET